MIHDEDDWLDEAWDESIREMNERNQSQVDCGIASAVALLVAFLILVGLGIALVLP